MHGNEANSLKDVGSLFAQLGVCMVEVGLLVARLCDYGIFQSLSNHTTKQTVGAGLEQAIWESGTAKGRLIHYHSIQEKALLTLSCKAIKNGNSKKKPSNVKKLVEMVDGRNKEEELFSNLWQQWHCDYGILTVLTAPLFLKSLPSCLQEDDLFNQNKVLSPTQDCSTMESHQVSNNYALNPTDLKLSMTGRNTLRVEEIDGTGAHPNKHQLAIQCRSIECWSPDGHSGLQVMDSMTGGSTFVAVAADCLLVQVGEAAQILSGGKLVARAHCVARPTAAVDVSRETMAVFLQPAWERSLMLPMWAAETELQAGGLSADLETLIPPLTSRWRQGSTFAEFSQETTRQYYGVEGRQSRREQT